ncbi:DUF4870 domain-containing protein [Rhodopirellula sp. JC740]|uniref:DUF4870 domain-containing protein n=2 Tax=Rhodopirellula halodulae TaxID=2894198 RepID=A0ABS8NJC9_9BACT|nr:DUF4870 domain-containing protein [Rhodopirellula sp. JC740]MCC9643652.1 DUF4870 domain-containing protein [Rhodopirellula sp. JC740]
MATSNQTNRGMKTMEQTYQSETKTWAMILHFSQFAGYVVPIAGFLAPIIIWQLKKNDLPELDAHGRNVTNWIISEFIYSVACFILIFVGIGFLGFALLALLSLIFPIIGGVKASQGEVWKYPLTLSFI